MSMYCRISYRQTVLLMALCLFLLYWAATKLLSQLEPAKTNTGPSTCQSATSTTTFGEHIVMVWFYWASYRSQKVCFLFFLGAGMLMPVHVADKRHAGSEAFRNFRRQLSHTTIAQMLEPLRKGITTPEPMRCPDGHFRRSIFGVGPYIGDYPEQCMLSAIVQG